MVNKVQLIGNLGKDIEVKTFSTGGSITTSSMATNENYKDKSGEWQTKTECHNLRFSSFRAEAAQKVLRKGQLVYIEGKITSRSYEDNQGNEKRAYEIFVTEFKILSNNNGNSQTQSQSEEMPKQVPAIASSNESLAGSDDLPF